MAGPSIKICGVSTPDALDAAIAARADYVGFVFYPRSPRHLDAAAASRLATRAGPAIAKVGLFVDPDDAMVADAVEAGELDVLQLHGDESPERAARLRERFGLPVWKAVPVARAEDVAAASRFRGAADLLLFDAKTPEGELPGGMGLAFDWSLLSARDPGMPWGLAGGLSAGNVANAVRETGAPLVDTSSGVESGPGVKDVDKIAAFCEAARRS